MMMGAVIGHEPVKIALTVVGGIIANGTSVTVTATQEAYITGGFPPYTHGWTDNMAAVFVQASASITTRLQATGTNIEHQGSMIYTLTEANGVITTVSASISLIQGTP